MRCPTLSELPPPPPGKTGWPWTEESPQLPDTMPDGRPWPRVSIVTPSYNQAQFIEETIRSVLLQGYPDLEYIIIDGGSTDGSVDIIRKYEPWLAYWVSEPDRGQSHAINKGFERATGVFFAWINSDDFYEPQALAMRVDYLLKHPACVAVAGDCKLVDEASTCQEVLYSHPCTTIDDLLEGNKLLQPSVLISAEAFAQVGKLGTRLHYMFDYDLWIRLVARGEIHYLPGCVANFRYHGSSKSVSSGSVFMEEQISWLHESAYLRDLLSSSQLLKLARHTQVRAGVEFFLAERWLESIEHFRIALRGKGWPYGSKERLAERLAWAKGIGGQAMEDSTTNYEKLKSVLTQAHTVKGYLLWRRIMSVLHMKHVFQSTRLRDVEKGGYHLLRGIYYDPSWLFNRGVVRRMIDLLLLKCQIQSWVRGSE